ncbi:MAG TPA: FHA domain-containing protein [Streptosporangiaceae bacterium]|nr:FHA domain-containing protein [Streptosporangiaceae bacterium]
MATLTCPTCAAAVGSEDLICFTCGTNLPRQGPVEDEASPPTVMQEYLRRGGAATPEAPATCPACGRVIADRAVISCPGCGRRVTPATGPISAVVLRLSFPTGNVDVPAGTSLVLGRDPGESLVAAAFAPYENVSRRHATITVSDLGEATIRDEHSTNGTFVNDDRVLPGTDVRLGDGDSVRLAADVSAEVSLPVPGAVVDGFSPNGRPGPH